MGLRFYTECPNCGAGFGSFTALPGDECGWCTVPLPTWEQFDTMRGHSDGCGGCENGECCGACTCCSRSRFDVIGHLTVTDETGYTHTVTIRREDLTTTNAGFRAIRDDIVETLETVFDINRS
jgi:hypothetical protein